MRLRIAVGEHAWSARVPSGQHAAELQAALPFAVRAVQGEWSGDFMDLFDAPPLSTPVAADAVPFQYPGQLVYVPTTGALALCFGEGRLQDGFGPLPAVPIAVVEKDLAELARFGKTLQFSGARVLELSVATGDDEDAATPSPTDRQLTISLGAASARAVLLDRTSPRTAQALAGLLPLQGRASNTYSSGPFTRFWNDAGGEQGVTPLGGDARGVAADEDDDRRRTVASPGFVYYMTSEPHNGLRIAAREATMMKSALVGGVRSSLVPVAQLVGDWAAFRDTAANLRFSGSLPMRLEHVE